MPGLELVAGDVLHAVAVAQDEAEAVGVVAHPDKLLRVLEAVERAAGSSVLFSSHILDVVEKVCNKVAVIKQGHLLYSGPTVEITGTKGLEEVFMEMNSDENFVTSIEK